VKTGCKLAESSKEGCGSKKGRFADGDDDESFPLTSCTEVLSSILVFHYVGKVQKRLL
jgi:hypothetical protein